jgi:hypothetical protein
MEEGRRTEKIESRRKAKMGGRGAKYRQKK